ncbi:hypothetical protein WMF31_00705 [Sorangium sp. So ce1036]|uniref:hypothetical protein n=1 Tax=Sorangium sp. So ce1036 TaxID=3133328 RepID=UPI003F0BAA9F
MQHELARLVAHWVERLRMRDWDIQLKVVDDLRTPDGFEAYGLCDPFPDAQRARIYIRAPRTPEDKARVAETVVHELLHAKLSPLVGANREPASIAAEEQFVWSLAPLLAELRGTADSETLVRAMVRAMRRPLRAGGRSRRMDPNDLATLATEGGAFTAREDVPEDVKGWITKAIAAMAGGSATPEETPPAAQQDEDKPMPTMQDDEEKPPVYQRGTSRAARATQPSQPTQPPQAGDLVPVIERTVRAAVAPLAGDLDSVKRDQLLERAGGILTDEQLRWARSQPFTVVKGLLDATASGQQQPAQQQRAARASAPTRGGRGGGLAPGARDPEVDRKMGINRGPVGPERTPDGGMQINPTTPGQLRAALRAGFERLNGRG